MREQPTWSQEAPEVTGPGKVRLCSSTRKSAGEFLLARGSQPPALSRPSPDRTRPASGGPGGPPPSKPAHVNANLVPEPPHRRAQSGVCPHTWAPRPSRVHTRTSAAQWVGVQLGSANKGRQGPESTPLGHVARSWSRDFPTERCIHRRNPTAVAPHKGSDTQPTSGPGPTLPSQGGRRQSGFLAQVSGP